MKLFRCPICREPKDVRLDKNQKYYLICNDCGTQLFVRGQKGMDRMEALIEISGDPGSAAPGDLLFKE